jgi:Flp pilus assembly protein TadB
MKTSGRTLLEWFLLMAVALLMTGSFNLPWTWKLMLVPPMTAMLGLGWKRLKSARQILAVERGYTIWLSDLAARLGNGETFERAIARSGASLARHQSVSSLFAGRVRELSDSLTAGLGLERGLRNLLFASPCPSVEPLVLALPLLRQKGCRLDLFLKDGNQLRRELAALEAEMAAEQGQNRAEALILAGLPFVLPLALGRFDDYRSASHLSTLNWILESTCLLVAVGTLVWVLLLRQQDGAGSGRENVVRQSPSKARRSLQNNPAEMICNRLFHKSGQLIERFYQIVSGLETLGRHSWIPIQHGARRDYFFRKAVLMLTGALMGIVWHWQAGWSPLVIPALAIATMILQDWSQFQINRRQVNQYRLEYPVFCHWLTALLQNGIPVGQALLAGHRIWSPAAPSSAVATDLEQISRANLGGRSLQVMIEATAERCPVSELQAFWHAVGRYNREGGQPLLQLLQLQNQANFQLLRNGRRQQLGEQQLILLVPMMLDLFVILTLAAWPAISQLMTA